MNDCNRSGTKRWISVLWIGCSILGLAMVGGPVAAQERAVIWKVEADGADLRVGLGWDTSPAGGVAQLVVRSASGTLVVSVDVAVVSDAVVEVLLPGALGDLASHGWFYEITLEDPSHLAEPMPLHVRLDCPDVGPCDLRAVTGAEVYQGALTSLAASQALDGVSPGFDLLGDALATYPDLRGDLLTLAAQVAELTTLVSKPASCHCQWTYGLGTTPEDPFHTPGDPTMVIESEGVEGPGAVHVLGAQTTTGLASLTGSGREEVATALRCWRVVGWSAEEVDLPGQMLEVDLPILDSCDSPCSGEVENKVAGGAYLRVDAVARGGGNATAVAEESFAAWLDGTLVIDAHERLAAKASSTGQEHKQTKVDTLWRKVAIPSTAPTTVVLESLGDVETWASPGSYGFADLTFAFAVEVLAKPACGRPGRPGRLGRAQRSNGFPSHFRLGRSRTAQGSLLDLPSGVADKLNGGIRVDKWCS